MDRPSILIITDLANGAEMEDIMIADFLHQDFRPVICHPADSEALEDSVDAILIRNYWNDDRYGEPEPWYDRWRAKTNLPIHDDLYIKNGFGKDYLLNLYSEGFPVIPTIDTIRDLERLPATDSYFIKPKDGFSAINTRKLSREELLEINPKDYLIQPFVDFEYEISFYYLDKQLQYTLYAPNKEERWDLDPFTPCEDDLRFAEKFIGWNRQKHGIERIDGCRLKDGSLQLVEITDQGGAYLSVPRLPEDMRIVFLRNLSDSLKRVVR